MANSSVSNGILVLLGLGLAAALGLPTRSHAADTLTLEEALAQAVEGNQAVRNSRYSVESAEGGLLPTRAIFEPQFTLSGDVNSSLNTQFFGSVPFDQNSSRLSASSGLSGQLATGTSYSATASYTRNDAEQIDFRSITTGNPDVIDSFSNRPQIRLGLTQEVLRGHRYAYNRRQIVEAQTSLTVAELQLKAQEQRTLRDAASAYWAWWSASESADIARERVSVAEEALRIGALQLEEGRVAPVDVSRLRTEVVRAKKALADAEQLAAESRDTLLVLIGRQPGEAVSTQDDVVPSLPAPPSPEAAMEAARNGNPDLVVLRQQVDQAAISLSMAKHALLPSLTLDGSATFSQVTNKVGDEDPTDANNRNLQGTATLTVPLGNRSARGEVARAAATEAQRRNELEGRERDVLAQVAKQARVLAIAEQQITLADQEVALAEETLKAEEARANVGRAVQRDVLEARVAVFDAKLQAAKARSDRQLAWIELQLLQGTLTVQSAVGK